MLHNFIALFYRLVFAAALLSQVAVGAELGQEQPSEDEAEVANRMIEAIKKFSLERYPDGRIRRFNQLKSVGCLAAKFKVPEGLPNRLRYGIFSEPASYPAVIRFANASKDDDREKDFRGMSIKISNLPGDKLWGDTDTQDFLLNSYPALIAGTPAKFLDFVETADARWKFFVNPGNWRSLWIALKGRDKINSPLDIPYWSTTPSRFGADESIAVKYSAKPCSAITSEEAVDPGEDYLSEAIRLHLDQGRACFDFMVQFQTDADDMPIEDASVAWDESKSPFLQVARITIQKQDFLNAAAMERCEAMTFNPWQSLPAHRPIGGINRVRRAVYEKIGEFRTQQNETR